MYFMNEGNFSQNDREEPVFTIENPAAALANAVGSSLILRGVLLTLFGLFFWLKPVQTMNIIIVCIGIFLLIDSIPQIINCFRNPAKRSALSVIPAAVVFILGILCVFNALGTAKIGIIIIGIWQIVSGFQSFAAAKHSGILGVISALLTLLVGVILVTSPLIGLLAYTWLLALCVIISGVSSLLIGIQLRRIK